MDVIPADVFAACELDQDLSTHIDGFDLAGETGKPFQFGHLVVHLDELVGPFLLQFLGEFKRHRVPFQGANRPRERPLCEMPGAVARGGRLWNRGLIFPAAVNSFVAGLPRRVISGRSAGTGIPPPVPEWPYRWRSSCHGSARCRGGLASFRLGPVLSTARRRGGVSCPASNFRRF